MFWIEGEKMARKKADSGSGGPNWLDTYADMVTLLLTFFILLFAMSSVDASKWTALVKAFSSKSSTVSDIQQIVINPDTSDSSENSPFENTESGGAGDDVETVNEVLQFDDIYKYLKGYVEKNKLEDSVNVYKGEDYAFVIFQNSIFFNGSSAVLRQEGKDIIDYLCNGIDGIPDEIGEIRIYGHTAQTSTHDTVAAQIEDRSLSSSRAVNVLLYIQLKNIINPSKLVSEGFGEYRPLFPHDGTEATRIKNRRVELYIARSTAVDTILEDIYADIRATEE